MGNGTQTQWDFGDIPPQKPAEKNLTAAPVSPPSQPWQPEPAPVPPPKIHTVSEITWRVRSLLEREFTKVSVTGEISNLRVQNSGHVYFSLKDEFAQISCVLFRTEARAVPKGALLDGQKIVAHGELTVYEARGQYQLRVVLVELQGLGALQAAFEKLKRKLQAEGLFAQERKRPLPKYPRRIGIVTSSTGAALRDVLHVIGRRHAALEIVLASCRVQGTGAAEEIACAVELLNDWSARADVPLDLILVARGGGSLEDLWAFNEEVVARAVFNSRIPVISGVGHEIDFTICDFVADVRAATPSAAAEIITEALFASRTFVTETQARLQIVLRRRLDAATRALEELNRRLNRCHPTRRLREFAQRLDDAQLSLSRSARTVLRQSHQKWLGMHQRFQRLRPAQVLALRRELVAKLQRELVRLCKLRIDSRRNQLDKAIASLRLLSPLNTLERGYSITIDERTGAILRNSSDAQPGQILQTQLRTGKVRSAVLGG